MQMQDMQLATLHRNDLEAAVELHPGADLNDWLAFNIIMFYTQVSVIFDEFTSVCNASQCPRMQAGARAIYLWQDGRKYKSPTELSAPEYVRALFDWVDAEIANTSHFPVGGGKYPKDFKAIVGKIMSRLFRVYAHLYADHMEDMEGSETIRHLNTSLRHFILFSRKYNLVPREQFEPIKHIVDRISPP
jgi:MOB kinase activator 1